MRTSVEGRVKNTAIPVTNPFLPLFEAIVNSIHAIDDAKMDNGRIDIHVVRDNKLDLGDGNVKGISDLVIKDNGVGFDESNFESFNTSDSTYKSSRGSKGLGRFGWLVAFQRVTVDSVYEEEGVWWERKFEFIPKEGGVANLELAHSERRTRETTVRLESFKSKYKDVARNKASTIANKIIDHLFVSFTSNSCPAIFLHDDSDDSHIDINELFRNSVKVSSAIDEFTLKGIEFQINFSKVYPGDCGKHTVNLCGDGRVVLDYSLAEYVPDVARRIRDESGEEFTYLAHVSSDWLDRRINQERTDFSIPEKAGPMYSEPTKSEIREVVSQRIKVHINHSIENVKAEKLQRVRSFIEANKPEYRILIKYIEHYIDGLPPDISDERLDIELYKISTKLEIEVREKTTKLISERKSRTQDLKTYKEEYNQVIGQVSDLGQAKLAHYVVHRKTIINLLEASLELQDDGKYSLEESVHSIVFPLKCTSDDLSYESQNLWLIDERLAFHSFLASDTPFDQMESFEIQSRERPDLLIFNNALAFSESGHSFTSMALVEFKRPERSNYPTSEKDPIEQLYGYIKKIRAGKMKDRKGRTVNVPAGMPFYCYVICDITPKIKEIADNKDFTLTPDGMGYFYFSKAYGTYIEVISYTKLLEDAKKRNCALFDRLHITS